ncbi:MAG: TraX family protein [Acutalibacteraceae bacterium]
MKKVLDRDAIRYIAIFAMLLDHIAWYFLEFSSPEAQIFHFVGRITAPIMCFFIAEGYHYTRNLGRYASRLLIFAVISQFPWWYIHGEFFTLSFNMLFTLFFGLMAVHAEAKIQNGALRTVVIALLCLATIKCDWYVYAVLWCVIFYKFRDNEKKKFLWFSAVNLLYFSMTFVNNICAANGFTRSLLSSLFTLGTFLSIPLLLSYNGQKGKYAFSKWVFYVFYPLHMLILALIKQFAF